jgi:Domain of unknown function (DUF4430)
MRASLSAGLAAAVTMVAIAAAVGGCGLGAGPGTRNAAITVTRDFGSQQIGSYQQRQVPGAETVMQMLERHFRVSTRYGGGFVQMINGDVGTGAQRDWFYYVNGIEASKGAAVTAVHRGDRIWWDLHDWGAADSIPAVVGSFPEPFESGVGGKRLPTVLACAGNVTNACNLVAASLRRAHIPFADQLLGGGSGSDSLAIVVGPWARVNGLIAAELFAGGPRSSGVYARFVGRSGQALELLDPAGQVVRTLRADAGLVAATEQPSLGQPTWLVTGTDVAGVDAAAAAMTPDRLRDHFALALDGRQGVPLPILPSR